MSLAFRFKAGGSVSQEEMAPMTATAHHHRSTTKVDHKRYKSRFTSKSALKDQAKGKVENRFEEKGKRRTPHQQVMSKIARRNQARQLRTNHHAQKENESSIFQGKDGAPKHVAILPLSANVDLQEAVARLNRSVEAQAEQLGNGFEHVKVDRFRRSLLYMPARRDTINALDVCRMADWVVLALDAEGGFTDADDEFLRTVEGQGISNVVAVVQGLEAHGPAPKRSKHLVQLKAEVSRYFPTLDKVSDLENSSDCANLVRTLCTANSKGIRWRDERSWMLVENVVWEEADTLAEVAKVTVSGTVRGKGLNPDRLVHVSGWGDFQVSHILEMPVQKQKRKADEMSTDETARQWDPSADRDDLAELAPEVPMNDATSTVATNDHKGVLLDDHHYFSDDESHVPPPPKRLPQGTSAYQAAWYLDDVSDSDSDVLDDVDEGGDVTMDTQETFGPEDGVLPSGADAMTDAGVTEYPASEMHVDADDEDEAKGLEEYRANRRKEAEEDLEFPDEIELHPDVSARERLSKYRGLKSLRTSEWNTEEDAPYEPSDYKRLLQIQDYKKSRNAVQREALAGGAPAGTKVLVQLLNVPVLHRTSHQPLSMFSLLRHEHKQAVVNLNMTLHSSTEEPIKSKEELIVQIGPRRFCINPIFSAAGTTPNNVHKFDRFLHPGQTAIATFMGPLTWGSVPVLVFKRKTPTDEAPPALVDVMQTDRNVGEASFLKLVGTATTVPPSHNRVVAKRVILTGHPFKIHKKLVTIRYMFFNREDVAWFAALPLWTKRGRQGFIKESLGTHGYFKATFDGKINPMDAVGVSLYKRVWPRPSRPFHG